MEGPLLGGLWNLCRVARDVCIDQDGDDDWAGDKLTRGKDGFTQLSATLRETAEQSAIALQKCGGIALWRKATLGETAEQSTIASAAIHCWVLVHCACTPAIHCVLVCTLPSYQEVHTSLLENYWTRSCNFKRVSGYIFQVAQALLWAAPIIQPCASATLSHVKRRSLFPKVEAGRFSPLCQNPRSWVENADRVSTG